MSPYDGGVPERSADSAVASIATTSPNITLTMLDSCELVTGESPPLLG
jgi:hypothetical protein